MIIMYYLASCVALNESLPLSEPWTRHRLILTDVVVLEWARGCLQF